MGQRERAREIVSADDEFAVDSNLTPDEVLKRAHDAADASKRGLGAGIRHHGDSTGAGGSRQGTYSVRGPGGVVALMDFAVVAEPSGSATSVSLRVGDFLFQKGSLGMKPSINARSTMMRFVEKFKASLRSSRQQATPACSRRPTPSQPARCSTSP